MRRSKVLADENTVLTAWVVSRDVPMHVEEGSRAELPYDCVTGRYVQGAECV